MRKSSPSLGQKIDLKLYTSFYPSEWKQKKILSDLRSTCGYERTHVLFQEL